MDLKEMTPLVIYDNECYLCVQFAKFVNFLAKGRLRFVGHYTDFGKKIRENVLDSNALEMFWFIDNNTAYGGRDALGRRSLYPECWLQHGSLYFGYRGGIHQRQRRSPPRIHQYYEWQWARLGERPP